jgi:hypothetical protein
MFNYLSEIIDGEILNKNLNLSNLWALRETLKEIVVDLEEIKDLSIMICDKKELLSTEKKLYYLNRNIDIVENIMVEKENQIFEFVLYDEICLN